MPKLSFRNSVCPLLLSVLLVAGAGCGGGGSSGGAPSSPSQDVAAQQAWQSVLAGNRTLAVSGRGFNYETLTENDLFTWTYSFSAKEAASSPADGSSQWRVRISSQGTAASTGNTVLDGGSMYVHFDSSNRIIGHSSANGCSLVANAAVPPQSAGVSAAGDLSTVVSQPLCLGSANAPVLRYSDRWSIQTEASIRFFCWTINSHYITDEVYESVEYCFEADQAGTIGSRARVRYPGSLSTIALRNY